MRQWLKEHRKVSMASAAVVLAAALGLWCFMSGLRRGAAGLFNRAMSEQQVLRGTVTAEKLSASLFGVVRFEGLRWADDSGETLLLVPSGSLDVNMWDVLARRITAETLEEVTLNNAVLSVRLDNIEGRPLDVVKPTPAALKLAAGEKPKGTINEGNDPRRKLYREWRNFDSSGRKLRYRLNLNDCRLEVFRGERHYILSHVQLRADINSEGRTTIDLGTGAFGGTMVGDGMSLKGSVDFGAQPEPTCDLAVRLEKVEPSSLGIGMKVDDRMTLAVRFTGALRESVGVGTVRMETLHIPAMTFSDIEGKVEFAGPRFAFTDVTAGVYGGRLAASGEYDLDSRRYHISGHGSGLRAEEAFPGKRLHCGVEMDIEVESLGGARETTVSGTFVSGPGKYAIVPFDSLSGRFTNRYRDLRFYDVRLEFPGFTAETEAFSIVNGKLHLGELQISSESSGARSVEGFAR